MKARYIALAAAVLLIVAAALWYTRSSQEEVAEETLTYGEYAYTCDSGVEFMLTLSPDLTTVSIHPVQDAAYPLQSRLSESPTDTGRRFRSAAYELHGRGESLSLYDVAAQKSYICEPQPKPNEAPLNFGD